MTSPHKPDDQSIVLYVDDGLEGEEKLRFEECLEHSAELRARVRAARAVRSAVAGLPRIKAELPAFDVLLERVDAEPSGALRSVLESLPHMAAPADLYAGLEAELRQLRRQPEVATSVASLRWRSWLAPLAAAAVMLVSSVVLYGGARPKRPEQPRMEGLRFDFVRLDSNTRQTSGQNQRVDSPRPSPVKQTDGSGR